MIAAIGGFIAGSEEINLKELKKAGKQAKEKIE